MDQDLPVHGPVFLIETDKIQPNPHQPRREFNEEQLKELAHSIREFGILQPLVVTKLEQVTETGTEVTYQLIAGERRLLAARMVGLERVPAIIRSVALDKEKLELAIIENVQRVDLNPIEQARAYAKLQDQFGLTQREIASRLGKSRESISNTVRLLSLPQEMQDAIGSGRISESQGRLLLMVSDMGQQQLLFTQALHENLSVREVKSRMQRMRAVAESGRQAAVEASVQDPEVVTLERELEEALGARVKLERQGEERRITITLYSDEELRGILEKITEGRSRVAQAGEQTQQPHGGAEAPDATPSGA